MKLRRILVPLDVHGDAEAALAAAVTLVRESGARLHVVALLEATAPVATAVADDAEQYLAVTLRRLALQGVIDAVSAVWSGPRACAIVKAADLGDVDVIVMAGDGAPGGVLERVLRGTTRPVLVVRPPGAPVERPEGDAVALPGRRETVARAEGPPSASRRYLDALRELQARERGVLRVVATIRQAASDLEHWQAVHVLHAGAGFPKEVTMAGRAIDASAWPSATRLADALAAWHETAETARTAWAGLPAESRAGLPPPP